MAVIESFKRRKTRFQLGINTGWEIFLQYIDRICGRVFHVKTNCYSEAYIARCKKRFWRGDDNTYHIKSVRLPELNEADENLLFSLIFEDTFGSYCYFDDKYDEKTVNLCGELFNEGVYRLVNDKVNVTVNPGDIVIDAGAWIGDFAAYAAVKGATVYAFEPTDTTFSALRKTAELNGNIIPVKMGLSDENAGAELLLCSQTNTGGNAIIAKTDPSMPSLTVETVRLDDFVRENNLPRVDFIKSDIEGFERHMLEGAQETLARFAPKLALCTYHLPDDPQVMEALIKKANPKYNVVQKRKKLFASVPKE